MLIDELGLGWQSHLLACRFGAEVAEREDCQAAWRRRGLCRALVHHVCRHAFDRLGLQRLVMCADPNDVAIGIYRAVGFVQHESHWCLQRRPRRDQA